MIYPDAIKILEAASGSSARMLGEFPGQYLGVKLVDKQLFCFKDAYAIALDRQNKLVLLRSGKHPVTQQL